MPFRGHSTAQDSAPQKRNLLLRELGLLLVMKRGRILGFDEGRPAGFVPTAAALQITLIAACLGT